MSRVMSVTKVSEVLLATICLLLSQRCWSNIFLRQFKWAKTLHNWILRLPFFKLSSLLVFHWSTLWGTWLKILLYELKGKEKKAQHPTRFEPRDLLQPSHEWGYFDKLPRELEMLLGFAQARWTNLLVFVYFLSNKHRLIILGYCAPSS